MAYEMEIDITFGSDAHAVDQVGFKYDEVAHVAKEIGFDRVAVFRKRRKEYYIL
jgi:histidinol-phosphatase (PHP family)